MNSITVSELKQRIGSGEKLQLIDVRESWEHQSFNIGGLHIPMQDVADNTKLIEKDVPVIFYCEKGIRSQIIIQRLQRGFQFTNLVNLAGGMEAWKKEG